MKRPDQKTATVSSGAISSKKRTPTPSQPICRLSLQECIDIAYKATPK